MDIFDLREPVNSLTHLSWLVLSIPGTWLLWKLARGDRSRQTSLLIYGASLAACFGSSSLFHGARGSSSWIEQLDRLDHIAIYLLIAGSYTPIAWNLMKGWPKRAVLGVAWTVAGVGAVRTATYGVLPHGISTAIYLALGWGALFCYAQLARTFSHRTLFPMVLGGILYSVGAIFNFLHWPVLWPGVFQSHELFHVFVMGGSYIHFRFIFEAVAVSSSVTRPPGHAGTRHALAHPAPHVPIGGGQRNRWRLALQWVDPARQNGPRR
jgi:hemolysin III